MPVFISLTGISLNIESLFTFNSFIKFILLIILITFIAGSYPAFVLSSVNPVSTIRDDFKLAGVISVKVFRKGLVIFQFFISISLIASAFVIKAQLAFIKNKNLGLTSDQVVVVPIYQAKVKPKYELFKKEILTNAAILMLLRLPITLEPRAFIKIPGGRGLRKAMIQIIWTGYLLIRIL
jgi:hypothetical protein